MTRYFGVHTLEGEWHSLLPRYLQLSDRLEGKQILDIGCGTGIGSSILLELGAERVDAIDHRPEVLELARVKHAKQGLDFHVMFWEELDFPDDTFDMVLCLDPSSPVTDPSLLLEIQRVLRSGGEYICAIERRNVAGLESLLPRYGYSSTGEDVELTGSGERVPQLGELEQFFETIISVVQRPRYSFVFDYSRDDEAMHTMRKSSPRSDESGLWIGDNAHPEEGSAEQTDDRPGRWISIDRRLCDRDGEPAAVEVLFCGDEHMPPPTLREIQMPYRGLVDRLHQLFSDLQVRQHPDQHPMAADDDPPANDFSDREKTSEFRAPPRQQRSGAGIEGGHFQYRTGSASANANQQPPGGWHQVREQLDRMTQLYQQVRAEMEDLFVQTRQELADRDRYIEQLVDTVHKRQHVPLEERRREESPEPESSGQSDSRFDREPTSIFRRQSLNESSSSPEVEDAERATIDEESSPSQAQADSEPIEKIASLGGDSSAAENSEAESDTGDADSESSLDDASSVADDGPDESEVEQDDQAEQDDQDEESSDDDSSEESKLPTTAE